MLKKAIKFALIGLLAIPLPAAASKYAGEFLNTGLGSSAMGMGGAYVSIANDAFACYWNPSGTLLAGHQLIFSHSSSFGSLVSHDAFGYSRPMGQYALGLTYIRLAVKDIPYTNDALIDLNDNGIMDPGERLDETKIVLNDDVESALLINYSRRRTNNSLWGLNLKFINKSIGPSSAWGLGIDAGAMASWKETIRAGITLQDITTTYLAWDNGTRELITPTVKIGTSYHPQIAGGRPLSAAAACDIRFEGRQSASDYYLGDISMDLHLGLEYWLKERIALRLGEDRGSFTAGAGVKLGRLRFDYAYMAHKYLESSTRISGSFTF